MDLPSFLMGIGEEQPLDRQVRELREQLAKQPQAHQVVEEAAKSMAFGWISLCQIAPTHHPNLIYVI